MTENVGVLTRPKTRTKTHIKNMLQELKLTGKTPVIDEFIKELEKIYT